MNAKPHAVAVLAAAVAIAGAATSVLADDPVAAISGGVGLGEMAEMKRAAPDYSTELLMVARGSGAYLADVDVSIHALPEGQEVLRTRTDGPMLLAQLAPGRYEVKATFADVRSGASPTVTRVIAVPRTGRVQQVIAFETADAVSAEGRARMPSR